MYQIRLSVKIKSWRLHQLSILSALLNNSITTRLNRLTTPQYLSSAFAAASIAIDRQWCLRGKQQASRKLPT
jgi:hypothetical protein